MVFRMLLPLQLFDETLRDGEQQVGICFSYRAKVELAQRIARTGVPRIDLMPAIDESEARLLRSLVGSGLRDRLSAATPVGTAFVDQALACGVRRLVVFYAVSDRLLFLRDSEVREDPDWLGRTIDDGIPAALRTGIRDRMVARVLATLQHAKRRNPAVEIDFAAEDASRADPDFLAHCLSAFAPFLDHFLLCDTVGVLRPDAVAPWIEDLTRRSHARLGVHFHNDMGLALENTLRAVLAGATMVSGTFGGIGERAGNVALDQVLTGLQRRHGIEVEGIDYDAVPAITEYLRRQGMQPAAPYSQAAQRHMSGMHVQSLLLDRRSYSAFPDAEPEIWFGKMSGTANFQYLFEKDLGRPLPENEYRRLSAAVKRQARVEGRCFSRDEVLAMFESGALDAVA